MTILTLPCLGSIAINAGWPDRCGTKHALEKRRGIGRDKSVRIQEPTTDSSETWTDKMASRWRENRIGLVVVGLALLAAAPAVTAAAGVQDRWVLAGATAVAAVVVSVGAVWQDRYRQAAQRRDEVGLRTEDGCLVLPDGRMPEVRDITDPVRLGVHRAAPATVPAEVPGGRDGAAEHV